MSHRSEHFRKLENMYHAARVNHSVPCRITVADGKAEVQMRVSQDYWHAGGAMHGCMYFKGLDDAAFFAANACEQKALVVTARFEVELLAMVTCEHVKAVGTFEKREGRKLWARSELFDDAGQLVARGSGLFIVSQIPLNASTGYA